MRVIGNVGNSLFETFKAQCSYLFTSFKIRFCQYVHTTIYLDISVVSSHGIKNPAQEKNVCFGTHFLKGSCTSVLRDM